MEHNHALATRIRDARLAAGLSQQALADKLGINLKTAGIWERTGAVPALRLAKLKQVLPALEAETNGWAALPDTASGQAALTRRVPFLTASEEAPLAQLRRLRRDLARLATELDDCIERLEARP
jgi:transcriptional regulator with XRE-family HTH domain